MQIAAEKLTIEKAIEQLNAKNNAEALRLFDQVIREGSNIPGINYGKAVALARIGSVNEAIELLEKLLSRIPNYGLAKDLLEELKPFSVSGFHAEKSATLSSQKEKASSQWLPDPLYADDIFITSYPKSGNTWLRFLLANLLKRHEEEIDFHTVHNYVPEVGKQADIIKTLKRPRIFKRPLLRQSTTGRSGPKPTSRCEKSTGMPAPRKPPHGSPTRTPSGWQRR